MSSTPCDIAAQSDAQLLTEENTVAADYNTTSLSPNLAVATTYTNPLSKSAEILASYDCGNRESFNSLSHDDCCPLPTQARPLRRGTVAVTSGSMPYFEASAISRRSIPNQRNKLGRSTSDDTGATNYGFPTSNGLCYYGTGGKIQALDILSRGVPKCGQGNKIMQIKLTEEAQSVLPHSSPHANYELNRDSVILDAKNAASQNSMNAIAKIKSRGPLRSIVDPLSESNLSKSTKHSNKAISTNTESFNGVCNTSNLHEINFAKAFGMSISSKNAISEHLPMAPTSNESKRYFTASDNCKSTQSPSHCSPRAKRTTENSGLVSSASHGLISHRTNTKRSPLAPAPLFSASMSFDSTASIASYDSNSPFLSSRCSFDDTTNLYSKPKLASLVSQSSFDAISMTSQSTADVASLLSHDTASMEFGGLCMKTSGKDRSPSGVNANSTSDLPASCSKISVTAGKARASSSSESEDETALLSESKKVRYFPISILGAN